MQNSVNDDGESVLSKKKIYTKRLHTSYTKTINNSINIINEHFYNYRVDVNIYIFFFSRQNCILSRKQYIGRVGPEESDYSA